MNGPPARAYWQKKMPQLSPTLEELDTAAMERAMQEAPAHRCRWVAKQITGQFAHGKNMQRCSKRSLAECPQCHAETEDKQHIVHCPDPKARQQWSANMAKLKQWLHAQGTDPELQDTLITHLETWSQDQQPNPNRHSTPWGDEQTQIGWDKFLDGWISQYWRNQQEKSWSQV